MKFKKHISLFLAFFLLVSNLGMAFNVHYCDNKIASVTTNSASNSCEIEANCCGVVEVESKCCTTKIVKSTDKLDQLFEKLNLPVFDVFIINIECSHTFHSIKYRFIKSKIATYYCNPNAPPLYLLYSQYTFYA